VDFRAVDASPEQGARRSVYSYEKLRQYIAEQEAECLRRAYRPERRQGRPERSLTERRIEEAYQQLFLKRRAKPSSVPGDRLMTKRQPEKAYEDAMSRMLGKPLKDYKPWSEARRRAHIQKAERKAGLRQSQRSAPGETGEALIAERDRERRGL
jgi:hypothetical protein